MGHFMKKSLIVSTALTALSVLPALAADLPMKAAPMIAPPPVYWTGFYIGGNVGGGMASSHFDDPCFYCSSATPTRGFFTGGIQAGYNWQFGNGLVGVEADFNGNSGFKGSVLGGDDTDALAVGLKADYSGTIRGRAGLVLNNALIYVTGGAAWAHISQTGTEFCNLFCGGTGFGVPTGVTANAGTTAWGGVIGAGVEFKVSPNWTVGAEILHTVYADHNALIVDPTGLNACGGGSTNCFIRGQLTTDVARIRFNYLFNTGGSILAGY